MFIASQTYTDLYSIIGSPPDTHTHTYCTRTLIIVEYIYSCSWISPWYFVGFSARMIRCGFVLKYYRMPPNPFFFSSSLSRMKLATWYPPFLEISQILEGWSWWYSLIFHDISIYFPWFAPLHAILVLSLWGSPFYPRSISISPAVKAKAFHPVRDAVKALSSKSEDAGCCFLGSLEQQGSMSMLLVGMLSIIPVYICINIHIF